MKYNEILALSVEWVGLKVLIWSSNESNWENPLHQKHYNAPKLEAKIVVFYSIQIHVY